jgi:DNA-binding SARP family transcriptional activator/tetratricopeptide (TPR) repeat protein
VNVIDISLLTFGELTLRRAGGEPVADSMRKPLLLLAVLAAEAPTSVSRERLLQLLWPTSTTSRARQALNQTLYSLRRALPVDPVIGGALLQLDGAVTSDIMALRHAVVTGDVDTALALNSRPFLEGLSLPGGVEFDHWVDGIRRELDASVTALVLRVAKQTTVADSETMAVRWRQYGERCLTDSLAVREAARQIGLAGNRSAAMQLLQRHANVLLREFEIEVDPETRALIGTLREATADADSCVSRNGVNASNPVAAPDPQNASAQGDSANLGETVRVSSPQRQADRKVNEPLQPTAKASPWRRTVLGIMAVAFALPLLFVLRQATRKQDVGTTGPSLLVAPFRLSGDTVFNYLGSGIAEEIASRLVSMPSVTLYPPSVLHGTQESTALAQARRLGADYLLEGTIRTEHQNGRARARVVSLLISAATGQVVWTWSADRDLDGMLGLQQEIADSTARRVAIAVSAASRRELTTLPTNNPEAFDLYLRALQYLKSGRDGLPEARAVLREVVVLDSNFIAAVARLGETQARMNWYGYDRDPGRLREARRLIERSRRLATRQPEPHLAMAQWRLAASRDYHGAAAHLDTALQLAPANADALLTRANIARRMGRWEASVADYAEAGRLDPAGYTAHLEHGNTLLLMRRYAEARKALEKAQSLAPDAVDPLVWLAAVEVRAAGDSLKAQHLLKNAFEHVNRHVLVARIYLSFPELVRFLPPAGKTIREFALRDAYGDSALLHVLRAHVLQSPERASHLDSASSILLKRISAEPEAFAAYRTLARVRLAQGNPLSAMEAAKSSLRILPASQDAHTAMQALMILAEAELAAGKLDEARSHARQLLDRPSVLTESLVKTDPFWRRLGPLIR